VIQLPGVPPQLLEALIVAAAGQRLALVGGAVRDLLLHRVHNDPWRGLPDLDLVVEGQAAALVERLQLPASARPHGAFGTVELELRLPGQQPDQPNTWLVDLASARQEVYPQPAENPRVQLGRLDDDLARRDFSVNAMALVLAGDGSGALLLDPHGGQADLARRQLRLLHPNSLRDDPTRLLRAARYSARLGFALAPESAQQAATTLAAWPWAWTPGDDPAQAPPALGTRLRMELELLLEREPWRQALAALQAWGGLALLDVQLQTDRHWRRRLGWAQRLGLPLLAALVAGAADPLALAERLQLPHRQHKLLAQWLELRRRLAEASPGCPSAWCALLEAPGLSPEAVALALAAGSGSRRPLLHWWARWRQVPAPLSAAELMAREGLKPGPALGERLRQLRAERLDQLA
jgi:poly(A) polymerase